LGRFHISPAILVLVLVVAGAMILAPSPAAADPINWAGFEEFFTSSQTAIMVVSAVMCVFLVIAGFITVGASGGLNGWAVALFTGALVCVGILAAPSIVHWAQSLATG
jgi:hypothetical protein